MKSSIIIAVVRAFLLVTASTAIGSPILVALEGPNEVIPGTTFDVLFTIYDTESTPLFGYSLDVDVMSNTDAVGNLSVNIDLTNFFDDRNLISAGGAVRDPLFSDIVNTGDGGAFITTNTTGGSTVLVVAGVNDVLAQVFFDVSPDAFGDFTIELGPASAVGAVDFDYTPHTFTVVPEPSTLLLCLAGVAVVRRRHKS